MEECGVNGPTTLTSREENSMFVDTLPSPYYDMLIVNTFVDFGDLMYSVGRIEDGIKERKNCRHWGKQGGEEEFCFQ